MLRGPTLTLALSIALSAAPALAQEAEPSPAIQEARQRFAIAEDLYHNQNFAGALREWQEVYRLMDGHPNRAHVLFNIGRAYQELSRNREALEHFRRFLAEARDDASNRDDAAQTIRELELRLEIEGADGSRAPTGGGGFSPSPVGLVLAGVGGAAAIAGGVVGGLALGQDADARGRCTLAACEPEAYDSLVAAHTLANVADGLLWGGLAVMATGVVLTFVLGSEGGSEPRVAAGCTMDGCGLSISGVF